MTNNNRKKAFEISCWSVAIAVLIGALGYYNFVDKPTPIVLNGNNVGDVCPSEDIQIIGSDEIFNINNTRGKITLINFWATYCGPCVMEIPHFEEINNKYSEYVYTIIIHHEIVTHKNLEGFINSTWNNYSSKFGLDTSKTQYYTDLGGTGPLPMTIIVDQEGKIAYKYLKSITYELLEKDVKSLLDTNS